MSQDPVVDAETIWTPGDCAKRLKVSRSMIYSLIKRGELQAIHVGRLPRITERALVVYLTAAAAKARGASS